MSYMSDESNGIVSLSNISEFDNILLHLLSGCPLESLTKYEVQILIDRFGSQWRTALGYHETEQKQ